MTVLATGIILYRPAKGGPRILLLRNRESGHWGFPKGRREEGDAHEIATALREVAEETGWTDVALDPEFREEVEYVVHGTRDHGKRKRVVYFLGRAPEREPILSPEHDACEWADATLAQELLPFAQLRDLARASLDTAERRRAGATGT